MSETKQYKPRKAARMMRAMSTTVNAHKSTCKCLSCATVARTVNVREYTDMMETYA